MKRKISTFTACLVVVLFLFSGFMAWYTVSASSLALNTEDLRQQLEISRGRESRQKSEYDKAAQDLPLARSELAGLQALVDQANADASRLKARRKELRAEKKALEESTGRLPEQEGNQDE